MLRFKSLSIAGLSGKPAPTPPAHFGGEDNEWANIGKLATGLPWEIKQGLLTPADVGNAKGDLDAMTAQVAMQREYLKVQEQLFDRWEEVNKIQVELAKLTMSGRYTVAQLDAKAQRQYYDHVARMNVLMQENSNAQALAQHQQQLGVALANHQLTNDRNLLSDEYQQQTSYSDARYTRDRQSLTDKFRSKIDGLNNPRQKPTSEYEPTPGRVLQFRGRRAS